MKVITVNNYGREGASAIEERLVIGPGLLPEEAERIAADRNARNTDPDTYYLAVADDRELNRAW